MFSIISFHKKSVCGLGGGGGGMNTHMMFNDESQEFINTAYHDVRRPGRKKIIARKAFLSFQAWKYLKLEVPEIYLFCLTLKKRIDLIQT